MPQNSYTVSATEHFPIRFVNVQLKITALDILSTLPCALLDVNRHTTRDSTTRPPDYVDIIRFLLPVMVPLCSFQLDISKAYWKTFNSQ